MLAVLLVRLRLVHQTYETFDSTISHNCQSQVILCRLSAVSLIFINYADFIEAVQQGLTIFRFAIALNKQDLYRITRYRSSCSKFYVVKIQPFKAQQASKESHAATTSGQGPAHR